MPEICKSDGNSARVTTKVNVSILAMLQFSDDYHVRVISTGYETARIMKNVACQIQIL